jgi:phage tail-like protein
MAERFEFAFRIQAPDTAWTFAIPIGTTLISRDPGSGLQLRDGQVSRQHARIQCSETRCQIEDLGSTNGTWLNGVKLERQVPVTLVPGAKLRIGPFNLTLEQTTVLLPDEQPTPEEPPVEEAALIFAEPPAEEPPAPVESPAPVVEQPVLTGPVPPAPPAGPPPNGSGPGRSPDGAPNGVEKPPPGLGYESTRLIHYLPGIYQTGFMKRFLALFESILLPIEWNVDNFDLFLDPGTAPTSFLPWLANWYAIIFNPSWNEVQRRAFLKDAHQIYARRGTRWALSRVLEIYTGKKPEIVEYKEMQKAHTFTVRLPLKAAQVDRKLVESLIDMHKPAHTTYVLELQ